MRYLWDRKYPVFTRNSARSSLIADLEAKQPGKMILSFWHSMPLLGSRYILFINSWAAVCLSVNKENNGWSVVIVWNIHRISLFNLPIALRSITPIQLFWGPNLNRSIFRNQNKISVFSKVNKVQWGRLESWFFKKVSFEVEILNSFLKNIFAMTARKKMTKSQTKEWRFEILNLLCFKVNDWNLPCISIAICSLFEMILCFTIKRVIKQFLGRAGKK